MKEPRGRETIELGEYVSAWVRASVQAGGKENNRRGTKRRQPDRVWTLSRRIQLFHCRRYDKLLDKARK